MNYKLKLTFKEIIIKIIEGTLNILNKIKVSLNIVLAISLSLIIGYYIFKYLLNYL